MDNNLVCLSKQNCMPLSALQVIVYRDNYAGAHDEVIIEEVCLELFE